MLTSYLEAQRAGPSIHADKIFKLNWKKAHARDRTVDQENCHGYEKCKALCALDVWGSRTLVKPSTLLSNMINHYARTYLEAYSVHGVSLFHVRFRRRNDLNGHAPYVVAKVWEYQFQHSVKDESLLSFQLTLWLFWVMKP
ncbi:hypothetical protein VNO77_19400 [Canavalia gladiata]|uniref:Uncharacterized protein n=1 Tax=Canavalia gladiata TaxID=3824 RepID=A0AAN9LQV7_CANGL